MYIEEITIEGFKSYAQRAVVPNFDPYFNAITGLNGSGKSNILDSICFVLGITNLSQVIFATLTQIMKKEVPVLQLEAVASCRQTLHVCMEWGAHRLQNSFDRLLSQLAPNWGSKGFWRDPSMRKS